LRDVTAMREVKTASQLCGRCYRYFMVPADGNVRCPGCDYTTNLPNQRADFPLHTDRDEWARRGCEEPSEKPMSNSIHSEERLVARLQGYQDGFLGRPSSPSEDNVELKFLYVRAFAFAHQERQRLIDGCEARDVVPGPLEGTITIRRAVTLIRKLVAKLDEVDVDSRYQAVWEFYAIHGAKYTGPDYRQELDEMRAALSARLTL